MAIRLTRDTSREPALPGLSGPVRVDRRTKDLTKRLRQGDIAVIDHTDIDRVSGEALVARRPAAVVNAGRSISGRYPNVGPQILLDADIPLIDVDDDTLMDRLKDGVRASIDGDVLHLANGESFVGQRWEPDALNETMESARAGLSQQLEAFAANTMEYINQERDLLFDGVGVPEIATDMLDRHVLIVVRGYHYKEDLAALRHYIREYKPILIGVDGGADALVEAGHRPDIIVGDMDSVSDAVLTSGAEVVVHAYRDGRAPGVARVEALGGTPVVFPAMGTSEDIAMLLADDKGATLIVAVGTHATLVEFLDKGRAGMSSTFLTRLRVGSKLIDAKGVSRLYRTRISSWSLVGLAIVCLLSLFVALWSTPTGQATLQLLGARWDDLWALVEGLVT